ncbi:hypothetical protein RDV89_03755 [Nocardioides zeae]|uniref:Uncharacterized protein n=1 Tax=Nocardioides imazamoxiresistens TaxID=3231893 RepID=A0ABU3PSG0_9ACTN|nr:hypothetical protein [Nocardioides zeae]MDT9592165.1 hypothetical protein [Nocardioides zeae]
MGHPEQRWADLGDAAAALLPEAPAEDDVVGYLAWRELVWGTAERLARRADADLDAPTLAAPALEGPALDGPARAVTGAALLHLAREIAAADRVARRGSFQHHR